MEMEYHGGDFLRGSEITERFSSLFGQKILKNF